MNKYFTPQNYINFASNKVLSLLAPVLRKWERPYLDKYGNQPLKHQPIFIIGAPRTGSTILYQTLSNMFDVLYLDNLVCRLHRNFFFGFWLSQKLFGSKPHNNYQSDHGSTRGLHSPSECGQFWYRWLPRDHHFIDFDEITSRMVEEIRRDITAVINYFNKPLVFNNNNAGMRIRLIAQAFPQAIWIVCDRKPLFVAQSLVKARKSKSGSYEKWWSILPPNFSELQNKSCFEQVVLQHYFINKQIYCDLDKYSSSNLFITIHYEQFCKHFHQMINDLSIFINYNIQRTEFKYPIITCQNKIYFDEKIIEKINFIILRMNWNDYSC